MLEAADVQAGHDVLDVGCGTGVLAAASVEWVGHAGSVTGVDVNEDMLDVARAAQGDVSWVSGAAESLPFDDASFDRVVSQFALMFFVDPRAAIGEMARVLRPEGKVAVATWAALERTPGYAAIIELIRASGVARFNSLEDWIHTDVRGWTLSDMIDDQQYQQLLRHASTELSDFVTDDGRVEFAAPALIAVARR